MCRLSRNTGTCITFAHNTIFVAVLVMLVNTRFNSASSRSCLWRCLSWCRNNTHVKAKRYSVPRDDGAQAVHFLDAR
jgi:hypothetical protein